MAINPLQQPIQYTLPPQDPGQALLEGLQIGGAIRGMRQRRQQEEEAAKTKEQFAIDMQAYLAQPTGAGARDLMLKYPGMQQVIAESWNSLSKEMQDQEFKAVLQVDTALRTGNPEAAVDLLKQRRDALQNSGMDASNYDVMIQLADKNPEGLPAIVNLAGASADPKRWGDYVKTLEAKPGYRVLTDAEAREQVPNYTPGLAYQVSPQGKIEVIRGAEAGAGAPEMDTVQSSENLPDGTRLITMRSGKTIVEDAAGNILEGKARADAVKAARQYGVDITAQGAKGRALGGVDARTIESSFKTIEKIQGNLSNLDAAIAAIDAGANTGVIAQRFPSWNASTIALNNVQKRLGLDVIGSVTFGALSEAELALAMETALPTNLDEEDLRQWLVDKKAAQQKLSDYLTEQVVFLREGNNTVADWLARGRQGRPTESTAPAGGAPAIGTIEDGYRFLGGDPSDPNNWEPL